MKLSEIKTHLKHLENIAFQLPNGSLVPPHFHVTEVGKISTVVERYVLKKLPAFNYGILKIMITGYILKN